MKKIAALVLASAAMVAIPATSASAQSAYCLQSKYISDSWDLRTDANQPIKGHARTWRSSMCSTVWLEAWMNNSAQLGAYLTVSNGTSSSNSGTGHVTTPDLSYRSGTTTYSIGYKVLSAGSRYYLYSA